MNITSTKSFQLAAYQKGDDRAERLALMLPSPILTIGKKPDLNKVYPSYFTDPLPVREAVCVQALPLGASIEISVIAEKA